MNVILPVLATILGLLKYGNSSPMKFPFNSDIINVHQAVDYLNSIEGKTWIAGSNSFGEYLSLSEQESRMGSLILKNMANDRDIPIEIPSTTDTPVKEKNVDTDDNHVFSYDDLPENYDARKMYPHCTTISSIKDQSRCGSCWAVSTAAAFSDRLCIHSKSMINVNISSNHIISCTRSKKLPANGCHGGWEPEAWGFLESNGAVTGGDYGTFEGCQPYLIKPCGRQDQMPCNDDGENGVKTPICRHTQCSNEWYEPGEVYKVKSVNSMPGNNTHPNNEIDIRREIYRNGPVTAAYLVYTPFMFYKSGIFQMDFSGWPQPTSGHSVRIIGWGVENNIPYWTVANSWGRLWGEDGTFRILRGKNYCWFESFINSGIPDIPQNIN